MLAYRAAAVEEAQEEVVRKRSLVPSNAVPFLSVVISIAVPDYDSSL